MRRRVRQIEENRPRKIDQRFLFWANVSRRGWPHDASGWTFLGRAIDSLGKLSFGEDWTGHEAYDELRMTKYASLLAPDVAELLGVPWSGPVAKEELTGAAAHDFDINMKAMHAWRRMHLIRTLIIDAAKNDDVKSAYRRELDGEMITCPSAWWNGEHLYERFLSCKISPSAPIAGNGGTTDAAWLYVSSTDMRTLCESLASSTAGSLIPRYRNAEKNGLSKDLASSASLLPPKHKNRGRTEKYPWDRMLGALLSVADAQTDSTAWLVKAWTDDGTCLDKRIWKGG
jgi:hypothetical protein